MRVLINRAGATLEDADDFSSFDFASELSAAAIGLAMTDLRLGIASSDGEHAWFAIDGLVKLARRSADGQWQGKLAGMAHYASTRGWVDDAGRVRAHRATTD